MILEIHKLGNPLEPVTDSIRKEELFLKRTCVDTRCTTCLQLLSNKRALAQKSADYKEVAIDPTLYYFCLIKSLLLMGQNDGLASLLG